MNDKQIAVQTVAEMIAGAKNLLKQAEEIANEHGIPFDMHQFYEEVTGEYIDWYNSNC